MVHTHREEWVLAFYNALGIIKPEQIKEQSIADMLDIKLTYWRHPSKHDMFLDDPEIYICNTSPAEMQRLHFFHELGHILRHVDVNRYMQQHSMFSEWLESDAKIFEYYAALPYHMLANYDLNESGIVSIISEDFVIPKDFVKYRLEHFQRQLDYKKRQSINRNAGRLESASYNPGKWSGETKRIMSQLQEQVGEEVVNYAGLLRRD